MIQILSEWLIWNKKSILFSGMILHLHQTKPVYKLDRLTGCFPFHNLLFVSILGSGEASVAFFAGTG